MSLVAVTRNLMSQGLVPLPETPALHAESIAALSVALAESVTLLEKGISNFIDNPNNEGAQEDFGMTLAASLQVLVGLGLSQGIDVEAAVAKLSKATAEEQGLKPAPAFVTVTAKSYAEDQKQLDWLTCLEGAGVDNWSGMEFAVEEFRKMHPEED